MSLPLPLCQLVFLTEFAIDVTSILKAGEEGYFNSWLICAGGVHGTSNGPIRKTGAKYVLNPALQSKFAFYIGEGSNVHAEVRFSFD